MEKNLLDRPPIISSSLADISAIKQSRGIEINTREQIKELVEWPLVKGCEVFWDKNIRTTESSANSGDIQNGFCYIRIDFDSLSEDNKKIAQRYGEPRNDLGSNVLEIRIPVNESPNIISDQAVGIANTFHKQTATWIHPITLEGQLSYFQERYGANYPQAVVQERDRLTQPGAWEEECKRLGYYLDAENKVAYPNEELFKKAVEGSEPGNTASNEK